MGQKLESYYAKAKAEGGLTWQMRLAMFTKLSPSKAKDAPDTSEMILLFENAMQKLRAMEK